MVKEIQIFIEGGSKGQDKASSQRLRIGFGKFLDEIIEKARTGKIRFGIKICNDTDNTFRLFNEVNNKVSNTFICFLVDSDKPVENEETPKSFLQKNKGWNLRDVAEEQCHLMVQIMESWFLADIEALEKFYGQDFKKNTLPKNTEVEKIPKADVENGLKRATEKTTKGEYHKIKHGAELLEMIDVEKVRQASKHCSRLFETIYLQIG